MATWADQPLQTEYLRQVRRLRGQYAARPAELHRRLRELSSGQAVARAGEGLREPGRVVRARVVENPEPRPRFQATPGVSTELQAQFAELVTTRMQAGILRYSCRQELLGLAKEMGLGRFEANLVIATVQHRARRRHELEERASTAGRWGIVGVVLLVQAAIVGVVGWWWVA